MKKRYSEKDRYELNRRWFITERDRNSLRTPEEVLVGVLRQELLPSRSGYGNGPIGVLVDTYGYGKAKVDPELIYPLIKIFKEVIKRGWLSCGNIPLAITNLRWQNREENKKEKLIEIPDWFFQPQ